MLKQPFLRIAAFVFLLLLLAVSSARAQNVQKQEFSWAGHVLRLDLGATINLKTWHSDCQFRATSCGAQAYLEPFLEIG